MIATISRHFEPFDQQAGGVSKWRCFRQSRTMPVPLGGAREGRGHGATRRSGEESLPMVRPVVPTVVAVRKVPDMTYQKRS